MRAVKPYIIGKGSKDKRIRTIRNASILVICLSLGVILIIIYGKNKNYADKFVKKQPLPSQSSDLSSNPPLESPISSKSNLVEYANKLVNKYYGISYHVANDHDFNWSNYDLQNLIKPARNKNYNFPYLVSGDFNGDNKKPDIAIFMVSSNNKSEHKLVIFHAGESKPYDLGNVIPDGIDFVPKQNIKSHWEPKALKMKGDGIAVFKFESSSVLYYWNGKTYSKYWLTD